MASASDDKDVILNQNGGGPLAIIISEVGEGYLQIRPQPIHHYPSTLAQRFRVTQDLSIQKYCDPTPTLENARQGNTKGGYRPAYVGVGHGGGRVSRRAEFSIWHKKGSARLTSSLAGCRPSPSGLVCLFGVGMAGGIMGRFGETRVVLTRLEETLGHKR